MNYTWEELKNDIPKMQELVDKYGLRPLARKVGVKHPAILYHLDKNTEKKIDYGDYWHITCNNREFDLDKELLQNIRRDYCGAGLTKTEVCDKHKILGWKFDIIKKVFNITHQEPRYTKEEMMEGNIDDLAELTWRERRDDYQNKIQAGKQKELLKELKKYWEKDYYFNLADERIKEFWKDFDGNLPEINIQLDNEGYVLEINIPDVHTARLCWAAEVEENYDRKKAMRLFLETIEKAIIRTRHLKIGKIIFPLGNDMSNFDNIMGETTKGTFQDNDSRWQKAINTVQEIAVKSIERLRQVAPVEVILTQGNHDFTTSYHVIRYIAAYYRNNDDVIVDDSPKIRKYRKIGVNLIGWSHGDKEGKRIFEIMHNEVPKLWGETKYREWHLGHTHKREVEEKNGVIVRRIPSIAAKSSWEYNKGYKSIPGSKAYVWHNKKGLTLEVPLDRL